MLILTEAQVRKCLTLESCIAANRLALGALRSTKSSGISRNGKPLALPSSAVVPTRIGLPRCLEDYDSSSSAAGSVEPRDMTLFKPASYYGKTDSETIMGMKVISIRAKNLSRGKPTANATITMLDAETGDVSAILGGTFLTAARTAAGSAIATKLCLEEKQMTQTKNKYLVVFGAGIQAEMHIRMLHCILPGLIEKVTIFNRTIRRAEELKETLMNDSNTSNLTIHAVALAETALLQEAVARADIIVTATNTTIPIFNWSWVNPGCHINGVGSYLSCSEEVDSKFVRDQCITVSDTIEALEVGDLKQLDASSEDYVGLLGDLLSGEIRLGERAKSKCTFFKSVGTSIQDIFTSNAVIKNAQRLGIGTHVEL
jgi:ornithine cyclodeaminase